MKKLITFLSVTCFIIGLSSCETYKRPKYVELVSALDYAEYTKTGFFITESNSVSFEYAPLATIMVTIYEGEGAHWKYVDGMMCPPNSANPVSALSKAVEAAKEKGANAIINLKYEPITTILAGQQRTGIVLTGMAIKR